MPRSPLLVRYPSLAAATLLLALQPGTVLAQAQITALGVPVSQNFDTLASSGTSSTLPTGWALFESGSNANNLYTAGTGSSNAGDTYSFGASSSTERAFGGLRSGTLLPTIGAQFRNATGSTVTSLEIAYTGEQWRLGATGRSDRIDFQYSLDATSLTSGTWIDVDALDFVAPTTTGSTGALDGNAAANRAQRSATITALSLADGAAFWIRWNDVDVAGADDGLAVDDFTLIAQGPGVGTPALSIDDVSVVEGDSGTRAAIFTVSLSQPAGAGGVTFDIATADGTATAADADYEPRALSGQSIAAGASSYTFAVSVNGDTRVEPDETFVINVTAVTGATVADGQGTGTILNDDVALTPIHAIQGNGTVSPLVGTRVTTRGIVTALVGNGFFVQNADAEADADPETSEGLFVFTGSAPAAARGQRVQVTGTVTEFVPSADPFQRPLTQLTQPVVVELSSGHPLPTPVPVNGSLTRPDGGIDQLERLEGMRVSIASLTVVAPTGGTIDEPNAAASSNGVFHGVVTGAAARPFREPGIEAPEPPPSGSGVTIPPVPRFDGNPERIRVHTLRQVGSTALDVDTDAVVSNLVGVLDYAFRTWTVATDPGPGATVAGGKMPREVAVATPREFTVGAFNLQRFYDTVNDPAINEPVLTAAAFERRLAKASQAVRLFLRSPDIVAVSEVENLATLQAIAARINADAGSASPQYEARLVEGLDVGGIDVGFLVRTAPVAPGSPRVVIGSVTPFGGSGTVLRCPDDPPGVPGAPTGSVLNDRPPLLLTATVNAPNGASYPVTVIANHLRSLNGIASNTPLSGANACFGTEGNRIREKRQQQAEFLAALVQQRQVADPNERVVVVGDLNAFEFNDGHADVIGTIIGAKAPDEQTAVGNDNEDLVQPDLVNVSAQVPAAERYSFVFAGNAQTLDHALVNAAVVASSRGLRVEHPRLNADFNESFRNDAATPLRLSDHDPLVLYVAPTAFLSADLRLRLADSADPIEPGATLDYELTLGNAGPDEAIEPALSLPLPAGTTFAALTAAPGFQCTTPAVGAGGSLACRAATLASGASAAFRLRVTVGADLDGRTLLAEATATGSSTDPAPANNVATESTTVRALADLALTASGAPDPVAVGQSLSYTITVANRGPNAANQVVATLPLPAATSSPSLTAPDGWICDTPAGGDPNCSTAALANGANATLVLTVRVAAPAGGTVLQFRPRVTAATLDPSDTDNAASVSTAVAAAPDELFANGFE